MKISLIGIVVLGLFLQSNVFGQLKEIDQVKWTTKEVAKGITWKHAHTDALPGGSQNINVLEIDTRKRDVTLAYDKEKNRPTSEMAREAKALAAVNAGFFDMKNGGSTA